MRLQRAVRWSLALRERTTVDTARRGLLKLGIGSIVGATLAATEQAGLAAQIAPSGPAGRPRFGSQSINVRQIGAKGDGKAIDSLAIQRAIDAAAAAGGGTVRFSAGQYLCYSIHLKSGVALLLEAGSVIIAAEPLPLGVRGGYDEPEPDQPWGDYQDYGHNHWHNSLIWGVDLHDVAISGPGRIWGRGLSRENGPAARSPSDRRAQGVGNKSIALKNCHNVLLKDFQILEGGWFGILATGVDNLTIDGLTIDTNRDGMDIDCCRNVHVANCSVNSPRDDAIVFKSSFALGHPRSCENITIANCYVTGGYEVGSMLDGSWKKLPRGGGGRIKLGTESNGGFKNIAISNCVFECCHELALESVDGALLEDVVISNISMRGLVSTALFIRLGARLRGPSGTKVGAIRRVTISNIVSSNASSRLCCIISGIPGHLVEDVKISNLFLEHKGGGTRKQAALVPPENVTKYPNASMFGPMPAQGFFLRHVRNVEISDSEIVAEAPDERPIFALSDVDGADFFRIKSSPEPGVPVFVLNDVKQFDAARCRDVKDSKIARTAHQDI